VKPAMYFLLFDQFITLW